MQLGPIVMACRGCLAPPGDPCTWAAGPRDPGTDFHAIRTRDAAAASELLDADRSAALAHVHYVWRYEATRDGRRIKQCGCGMIRLTRASDDDLALAMREHREVVEPSVPIAANELRGPPSIDHEQNEAAELALAKAASKRPKAKLVDESAGVSRRRKRTPS